uniref:Uncharacterized protein n=1 Tax=Physcomitrium patens TaxID=3218 RepID=A0A2K1J8N7_PHYPA|nr:hypothetical protein PHYPA_021005 [Physcomitrium patens]
MWILWHSFMNVEYPSETLANIVETTLAVDPELQPGKVHREMSVQGVRDQFE